MEQRKLIRLGNSSFAIALPKDWVDKSGLKKGDEVFIIPNSNGEIVISSTFKRNGIEKEILINTSNKDLEKVRREFMSAYISGNTIFKFEGDLSPERRKFIRQMIKEFISCEVEEEKDKIILAKDFFNFGEINIYNFTKRADNNVREMFETLINSLKKEKISAESVDSMKDADVDINKIYFLNSRLMNLGLNNPAIVSILKTDQSSLFNNWWLTFHLEHIGDGLKRITKRLKENSKDFDFKKYAELIEEVKAVYEKALKAFYDKDKNKAHEVMEEGKKIWDKCDKLIKEHSTMQSLLAEKLKSIENASYQIVKMILNMEI